MFASGICYACFLKSNMCAGGGHNRDVLHDVIMQKFTKDVILLAHVR